MIAWITKLWGSEPVVIVGLVDAVLILLISFGVNIAPEQKTAIDGVLAALGVLLARSQVSPAP